MLKLSGFSKVNAFVRTRTRDLRVLWTLEDTDETLTASYPKLTAYRDRCLARTTWKATFEAYCARVEAG